MIARVAALVLLALAATGPRAEGFDHHHRAWDALLKRHVVLLRGEVASQVRYGAFARERGALQAYLAQLARVSEAEFRAWPRAERMAFLINAYNAAMIEKVLTRYPDLRSVWDFGKLFGNPFKDDFIALLGERYSLDRIEHDTLRKPGAYDEPRVHYALNCASVGCPMLREEAYVAERLEAQLESQARRFLADRSRNRFEPESGRLAVSEIFKWYREDWERGYAGFAGATPPIRSREAYFARYAELLAGAPAGRARIAAGQAPIAHLEYDWSLNDAPR